MFSRASFLLASAAVLICVPDIHAYQRFESATVVSSRDSFYLIRCEGIDFETDRTDLLYQVEC